MCTSDTHNKTDNLTLPDGDILIHAGDFTMHGKLDEIRKFADFMGKESKALIGNS